ncbi:MAG: hypothetical protein AAB697_03315 [Patescibacteria group bacterium]
MKNKKLAGLLSLMFPGLGHLYIGRYADGIGFLLGGGVLWGAIVLKGSYLFEMGGLRTLIFWGGLIAVYLYALVDIVRRV